MIALPLPAALAGALVVMAPLALQAQNEEVHPFTKANISPVAFEFVDEATDGCWTNAAQSPALAQAALEQAGLTFAGDAGAKTTLFLFVDAERDGSGCYGNMLLDLRGPAVWEGSPVQVILRDSGANFKGHDTVDHIIPLLMDHFVGTELAAFPED